MESEIKHHDGKNFKVEESIEPQETTEKRGREKGELTFEHDGVEVKVPYKRKNFEYSDKIQQETGILGYERNIITWEDLLKVAPGFSTILDNKNNYLDSTEYNFLNNLLSSLSNSQYPNKTLNHQIGNNTKDGSRNKYEELLLSDKFLLQEIFGLSTMEKGDENGLTFQHNEHMGGIPPTNFFIYKKEDNSMVEAGDDDVGLEPLKLTRKLTDDSYAMTRIMGLNFARNCIYDSSRNNLNFGFSPTNHSFTEYLEKSLTLLCEQNKNNTDLYQGNVMDYDGSNLDVPIGEILGILLSSNQFLVDKASDTNRENQLKIECLKIFEKLRIDAHEIFSDERMEEIIKKLSWYIKGSETHIPIVINNDEIEQLRWGNADYAHKFTSKGLNYLKINHVAESREQKLEE